MDNREAIKIMEVIKQQCVSVFLENSKIREACDLAISALEGKNKVHCGECKYMLGGYSGYYECSKNHWRVYKAYSCPDGDRKE